MFLIIVKISRYNMVLTTVNGSKSLMKPLLPFGLRTLASSPYLKMVGNRMRVMSD